MSSNVRYRYDWNHDNSDNASGFVVVVSVNYSQVETIEVGNDGTGYHYAEIVVPQDQYIEVQIMTKGADGVTLSEPVVDVFTADSEIMPPPAPNMPYNLSRTFVQFE
jgi:hypothetical protein